MQILQLAYFILITAGIAFKTLDRIFAFKIYFTSHACGSAITGLKDHAIYPYFTKADWMDDDKYSLLGSGKISVNSGGIYIVHGSVSI